LISGLRGETGMKAGMVKFEVVEMEEECCEGERK
jgi:hypothetical protein